MPFDAASVEPLTDVRAVELVREALCSQGRKSRDASMCLYHGPDGDRCAIGHLIPDWLYDLDMEGVRIDALLNARPELAEHFSGCSRSMLRALQKIHDQVPAPLWYEHFSALREVARRGWNGA